MSVISSVGQWWTDISELLYNSKGRKNQYNSNKFNFMKKIPVKQLKLNCELTSQWPEKIFSEFLYTITSLFTFSILLSIHLTRRIFQQSKLLATTIHLLWKGVWTPDSYTVHLTCTIPATGMIYREPSTHAQTNHEPEGSRVIILMALAGFCWDLIRNTIV